MTDAQGLRRALLPRVRLVEEAGDGPLPAGEGFSDVPEGSTHDEVLRKARRAGILEGDTSGQARPGEEVRRDHAASLVVRSLAAFPTAS